MNYQEIIEQSVTNGRGFLYGSPNSPENNSAAALQANLARMDGAGYSQVNELMCLDRDLKQLGLSDHVKTPEAVQTALGIKNYIFGLALSQARRMLLGAGEQKGGWEIISSMPPNSLEGILSKYMNSAIKESKKTKEINRLISSYNLNSIINNPR